MDFLVQLNLSPQQVFQAVLVHLLSQFLVEVEVYLVHLLSQFPVEVYLVRLLSQLPLVLMAVAFLAHPHLLDYAYSVLHLLKESRLELVPHLCPLDFLVLQQHLMDSVQAMPTTQDLPSDLLTGIDNLCPTPKSNIRHPCSMHNTRM